MRACTTLYEHSTRACYVCPLVAVPSRTPGFVMWRVEPEGRRVLGVLGLDSLRSWSADTSLRPGRGRGRLEARAGGWRADAVSCTCGSGPPPPLLLRPVRPLSVGGRLDPAPGALSLLAVGTFRSWRCFRVGAEVVLVVFMAGGGPTSSVPSKPGDMPVESREEGVASSAGSTSSDSRRRAWCGENLVSSSPSSSPEPDSL